MERVTLFVGLDYHDSAVQVCVMNRQGQVLLNRRCANDRQAIGELVAREGGGADVYAAIEACTGSAHLADELVSQTGWSVDLAHPGYVARIKGNPDKHDLGDAQLLADLERVGYLPRVWLAPAPIRELRRLVRYRQQLVNEARNGKLRIRALLREHRQRSPGRAWSVRWRHWLQQAALPALPEQSRWIVRQHLRDLDRLQRLIAGVEKRLQRVTAKDALVQRLRQQPGIGPVTAWTLRAEIGRFDRFRSGKQLAKFCGVSPRNASSGTRQADAGLVPTGNRQLRAVLIEAAHRLGRYAERWSRLAQSLRERGKPGSVVAAAIANRWVRWLYHEMQRTGAAA